jgi:hypothetical protein
LHLILKLLLLLRVCKLAAAWSCCISHVESLLSCLRQHHLRMPCVLLLLLLALQAKTQNPWCRTRGAA